MLDLLKKFKDNILMLIIILAIFAFLFWLSWIIVCFFTRLICGCFGMPYQTSYGTGVWLILFLLNTIRIKVNIKD